MSERGARENGLELARRECMGSDMGQAHAASDCLDFTAFLMLLNDLKLRF